MKEIEFEVTAEDIGAPGNWEESGIGQRCMLDRALDRHFGLGKFSTLFSTAIEVERNTVIEFDEATVKARRDWDAGLDVEPFTARGTLKTR